jgi:hypothetical protein
MVEPMESKRERVGLYVLIDPLSILFSHRHRMTEEEEDAELLDDAKEAERPEVITRFDQSPWCKFSRSYSTRNDDTVVCLFSCQRW